MIEPTLATLLSSQRQFFLTHVTLPYEYRIEQLKKLKLLLEMHEPQFLGALKKDLNKPRVESLLSEIFLIYKEIDFILKHLRKWMKTKKVATPFPMLFPGRSNIYYQPYGSVLIFSPWNFPYFLTLSPLIGAIAAGNCVVIKTSEKASAFQQCFTDLINGNFSASYLFALSGGVDRAKEVLKEPFDYIFFTGGSTTGQKVMEAAAKYLTPVTLELGGKSPCIVDQTANIAYAARRIAWAKFVNAGQTCVAPDYVFVHHDVRDEFINAYRTALTTFFPDNDSLKQYCKIINRQRFDHLNDLLNNVTILVGGESYAETMQIKPALIDGVTWDHPLMKEEIFGPILPMLTFKHYGEVINAINSHPIPLALYFFTKDRHNQQKIMNQLRFGGGCINDTLLHLANFNLPFGGVGQSGMGQYHGYFSFLTFSHQKSLYEHYASLDFKPMYPPYSERKTWWLTRLLRW
ncbi:MAG: aldehyde dehydrogenase family protein [Gammaproteobacteria bacterium]|nr:aldehyde dehydrogenase family protein [Gammaproteobacteria bacterium]